MGGDEEDATAGNGDDDEVLSLSPAVQTSHAGVPCFLVCMCSILYHEIPVPAGDGPVHNGALHRADHFSRGTRPTVSHLCLPLSRLPVSACPASSSACVRFFTMKSPFPEEMVMCKMEHGIELIASPGVLVTIGIL